MGVFKSKIDTWVAVIVGSSILLSILCSFWMFSLLSTVAAEERAILWGSVGVVVLLGVLLPLWLLMGTSYTVGNGMLDIRCGPMSWAVPLASISSVRKSKTLLSGPALSLDRLEIVYQGGKKVIVSPADEAAFLEAIGFPVAISD